MEGEVEKLKKCGKCKGDKKPGEFPKDKSTPDGFNYNCFQCIKEGRDLKQEKIVEERIKEQFIEGEIWKVVPGFSKYEASSLGRIRNIKKKLLIKPIINGAGYCNSAISDDNNKTFGVAFHRIIALTFIDNPENKKTVNHENKIRNDNRVENLSWATMSEQQKHVWMINPPIIKQKPKIKNLSDIEGEEWKDIPEYPSYFISNFGRIKYSFKKKNTITRITGGDLTADGYKNFTLVNENGKKCFRVHRLVAETFILNPLNKPFVNHEDGIKINNHVDNLSWTTPKENSQHAHDTGLNTGKKEIYQLNEQNEIIQLWNSLTAAANHLKIDKCIISNCLRKRNKTAGGFFWIYKGDYSENNKIIKHECKKPKLNQIDYNTNQIIKTWDSMADAARHFSKINNKDYSLILSNIGQCCTKKNIETSQGYKWRYENDNSPIEKNKKHKINQIDIETKQVIHLWNNPLEAVKYIAILTGKKQNAVSGGISKCARGMRESSYGYIWKYENNDDIVEENV